MAKKSVKLTVCMILAFLMVVLAACGGKGKESDVKPPVETEAKEEAEKETGAEDPTEEETQDSGSKKFATVADFANSTEVQSQLEAQKKNLAGSGMDIAITGEDNKLIYTFTYEELKNQEGMAEVLEQGMEAQADTFVSVAKSIRLAVDVENPVVIVRYMDANGEEIYSAEFTAE